MTTESLIEKKTSYDYGSKTRQVLVIEKQTTLEIADNNDDVSNQEVIAREENKSQLTDNTAKRPASFIAGLLSRDSRYRADGEITPTRPQAQKFSLYNTERKDSEEDPYRLRGKTPDATFSTLSKSLVLGKIGPLSGRNNPQKGPNIVKLSSYYKFMLSHSLLKGIKSNYYLSSEKLLKFMDANIRFCRNFYARYPKGLRVSKLRQIQLKPLTTDIKTIIFD